MLRISIRSHLVSLIIIIGTMLIIIIGVMTQLPNLGSPRNGSYTAHDPIDISSDSMFAAVATSGSGTEVDPFILEGWKILTNKIYGIHVHDTSSYFVIRNCWIETGYGGSLGIFIQHVANGTAAIFNNTLQNNHAGIAISGSTSAKIMNNTVRFNSWAGIVIGYEYEDSGLTIIMHNTISQNYITGLYISFSDNCSITWNLFVDGGLSLDGDNNHIHHNSFINSNAVGSLGEGNSWYDPSTREGNYWSDYSGEGSYKIGYGTGLDHYPLELPLHEYTPPKSHVPELLLALLVLSIVGILGVSGVVAYQNYITEDKSSLKNGYVQLLRIVFLILLLQNLLIILTINSLSILTLHLDIFGFSLLATGLILYSTRTPERNLFYLSGGICILGWVICRLVTQYVIPFGLNLRTHTTSPDYYTFVRFLFVSSDFNSEPIPSMMIISFVIGGISLASGSILVWYTSPRDKSRKLFLGYCLINLLVILYGISVAEGTRGNPFNIISIMFVPLLKGGLVPVLGALAFAFMWREGFEFTHEAEQMMQMSNGEKKEP